MKTIRINPHLELMDPVAGQVRNTKSGEVFNLSFEALSVISLFDEPKKIGNDLEGLEDIVKSDDAEVVKAFIESLLDQEVLIFEEEFDQSPKSDWDHRRLLDLALVEKPFLSCLSVPVAGLDSEYPYEFAIIGMPFDLGSTGFPGSRFGPSRLRELSASGTDYRGRFSDLSCAGWPSEHGVKLCEGKKIVDIGDVIHQVGEPFQDFFKRVESVNDILREKGVIPISIGGDHSCTYASVCSVVKYLQGKPIHLVVFDAHTDLADYDTSISHNHGNFVTRLLVEGRVQKVTHIGLRGMLGKADSRDGYVAVYADQCSSAEEVLDLIPFDPLEAIYVSFDVDVMDPVFAPGTGTPVPLGLAPQVVLSVIKQIFSSHNVEGFDIVEYNPMRDINDMTGHLLISMLPKFLNALRSR
jgi:agmatinase